MKQGVAQRSAGPRYLSSSPCNCRVAGRAGRQRNIVFSLKQSDLSIMDDEFVALGRSLLMAHRQAKHTKQAASRPTCLLRQLN